MRYFYCIVGTIAYARRFSALVFKAMFLWGVSASNPNEFEEQVAGTPLKYEALACEKEKERLARLWAGER